MSNPLHQSFWYPRVRRSKAYTADPGILWAHSKRSTSDIRFRFMWSPGASLRVVAVSR